MTSLPGVSFPPSIIGTGGTSAPRAMTGLPGVDRRQGHGRGEAPALARSMTAARRHDDQLAGVSFPPSIVGTTGTAARCQVDDRGTMTSLPGVSFPLELAAVDHRHGHGRGEAPALARSMTSLPGVSFPLELAAVDHRHARHHGRHDDRLAELPGARPLPEGREGLFEF